MKKDKGIEPFHVDSETVQDYYETVAASGHLQDSMYRESDLWDRYWHIRRAEHLRSIFTDLDGTSFLEVGCAEGMLMEMFRSVNPTARRTGLDIAEGFLDRARENDPEGEYVQGDAADLPFDDGSFEIVLCAETLEHTPDPQRVLGELARVASKFVVVTVPGSTLPSRILYSIGLLRETPQERALHEQGSGHLHSLKTTDVTAVFPGLGLSIDRVIVDCFVTVRAARFLRLSEKTLLRLDSILRRTPLVRRYGLVQIIVAGRS